MPISRAIRVCPGVFPAGLYAVRTNPAGGRFDLEELEPRVLLSAQPCSGIAAPVPGDLSAAVAVQESPGDVTTPNSRVAYDCTSQIDNILFESAAAVTGGSPASTEQNHPTTT